MLLFYDLKGTFCVSDKVHTSLKDPTCYFGPEPILVYKNENEEIVLETRPLPASPILVIAGILKIISKA